jgi:selenocysteine-specific elongation factor
LDRDVLAPGQSGFAQLNCSELVALPVREHVVLRGAAPLQTIAGGRVLETGTRRYRRNSSPTLQRLEELRDLSPAAVIGAEVLRQGPAGMTLQQLSQLSALAAPRIAELLEALPVAVTRSGVVVPNTELDNLVARIPALLAPHATGLSHEKLLSALPGTGALVLAEALARLRAKGLVTERGSQLLVPKPHEDRARVHDEAELAIRIAETLRRGGLTPPNPGAIVTDRQSKRAVDRLLREGVIVRAVERAKGREILFHRDAVQEAQRRLAPLLERAPGLLVTEVGEVLGISRKYSMPLLNHLDIIQFTCRVDDRRILAAPATRRGRFP